MLLIQTEDQFIEALQAVPRDGWYIMETIGPKQTGRRVIRRILGDKLIQCPISSLLGLHCREYWSAAEQLGLPEQLRNRIVGAADGIGWDSDLFDQGLQERMIKAVGFA